MSGSFSFSDCLKIIGKVGYVFNFAGHRNALISFDHQVFCGGVSRMAGTLPPIV